MRLKLPYVVIGAASVGTAFWLIHRARRSYQMIGPSPQWNKCDGCSSREFWIDETIEASFPASDPSSSTPVSGTGRLYR